MSELEFKDLDPLLHNELRLKIMAAVDALDSADFVYLQALTHATPGNLYIQITNLVKAGYIHLTKHGKGRGSHTVCRITAKGTAALREYQQVLMSYFAQMEQSDKKKKAAEKAV